jgi:hypothetical protein
MKDDAEQGLLERTMRTQTWLAMDINARVRLTPAQRGAKVAEFVTKLDALIRERGAVHGLPPAIRELLQSIALGDSNVAGGVSYNACREVMEGYAFFLDTPGNITSFTRALVTYLELHDQVVNHAAPLDGVPFRSSPAEFHTGYGGGSLPAPRTR